MSLRQVTWGHPELAVVACALLLPIPTLALSGLSIPLPAIVERGVASLLAPRDPPAPLRLDTPATTDETTAATVDTTQGVDPLLSLQPEKPRANPDSSTRTEPRATAQSPEPIRAATRTAPAAGEREEGAEQPESTQVTTSRPTPKPGDDDAEPEPAKKPGEPKESTEPQPKVAADLPGASVDVSVNENGPTVEPTVSEPDPDEEVTASVSTGDGGGVTVTVPKVPLP